MKWLNEVSTTNLKCVTGLFLAVLFFLWVAGCATAHIKLDADSVSSLQGFVEIILGISAVQFIGKRATEKPEATKADAETSLSSDPLANYKHDVGA